MSNYPQAYPQKMWATFHQNHQAVDNNAAPTPQFTAIIDFFPTKSPPMQPDKKIKQPISVLILLHDGAGQVLLLERADRADFWQSVTGSLELGETPFQAALREVAEETGVVLPPKHLHDCRISVEYEIYPHWRHRYAAGVTHNLEHWFIAQIAADTPLVLSEHTAYVWLPAHLAAQKVFSPSNREAIEKLLPLFQAA